jgi:steroid delta-isomerase-like uncharacterized protein
MATSTHTAAVPDEALHDFTERYSDAWNSHDDARMVPLVTEDVVWADPALPEPARGVDAVRAFMRESWVAFPDLSFEEPDPPHLTVGGDQIAWAWRMRGTMRGRIDPPGFAPTGRSIVVDGVDLWRMRDGRIAVYRAFYDMNDLARQLGIVPEVGSRPEKFMAALQRLLARAQRRRG